MIFGEPERDIHVVKKNFAMVSIVILTMASIMTEFTLEHLPLGYPHQTRI